jgi:hypothetical protein
MPMCEMKRYNVGFVGGWDDNEVLVVWVRGGDSRLSAPTSGPHFFQRQRVARSHFSHSSAFVGLVMSSIGLPTI